MIRIIAAHLSSEFSAIDNGVARPAPSSGGSDCFY